MNNIMLAMGKVLKGTVVGPIKASKLYTKSRLLLKKYEKQTGVIPLSKLKKKVYKSDKKFVDLNQEISNPLIKLLTSASSNTTDVYIDINNNVVLSCSYSVEQTLVNKSTTIICNLVSTQAVSNADYYYLACTVKHNVITDATEEILTRLTSKFG